MACDVSKLVWIVFQVLALLPREAGAVEWRRGPAGDTRRGSRGIVKSSVTPVAGSAEWVASGAFIGASSVQYAPQQSIGEEDAHATSSATAASCERVPLSDRTWPAGQGFYLGPLYWLAACEAGLLPLPSEAKETMPKFPQSFVERIRKLDHKRQHRFNFQGSVFKNWESAHNRKWVFDFARSVFTSGDYFRLTGPLINATKWYSIEMTMPDDFEELRLSGPESKYEPLGEFDRYLEKRNATYPFAFYKSGKKFHPPFDEVYWKVMAQSCFTLSPIGDNQFSIRFFEAVLAGSIPVVDIGKYGHPEAMKRFGLHDIAWNFYVYNGSSSAARQYECREDWIKVNYDNALRYLTFLSGDNEPPRLSRDSPLWSE
jgi:hypothetical protein